MSRFKSIDVVILAAGNGTRMLSTLPKPLYEIAGQTMIEYVLELALAVSSNINVVVNTQLDAHQDFERIIEKYKITKVFQESQLGTADAVHSSLKLLSSEYTLILYADVPFIQTETISKMYSLASRDIGLVVLGFEYKNDNSYGRIVVNEKGSPIKIVEAKEASLEELRIELCNSGVLLVKTELLKNFFKTPRQKNTQEYYLTDLVEFAYDDNKTSMIIASNYSEVMGINNKTELADAENFIQEKLRKDLLESGVTMLDPRTVFLTPKTQVKAGAVIHPFVFLGKDVSIDNDVVIMPFSHIEGAKIAKGCVIGPFARIRPDTYLSEKVKIGNFVEVKNSSIDLNSKAAHLSYIGDVSLGNNVNIGAGTVFCNYDGISKHSSKVGDGSFIGSNTSIVSPINIGKESVIAAGSVITEDVPAQSLAIARVRQENKKRRSSD